MPDRGTSSMLMFVLLILFSAYMFYEPVYLNQYSPLPSMVWQGDTVIVTGQIIYENGTPVSDIEVVLYGVDELLKDKVMTDSDGLFRSNIRFEAGQIITVTVQDMMLYPSSSHGNEQPFVNYDADYDSDFWLGVFVLTER